MSLLLLTSTADRADRLPIHRSTSILAKLVSMEFFPYLLPGNYNDLSRLSNSTFLPIRRWVIIIIPQFLLRMEENQISFRSMACWGEFFTAESDTPPMPSYLVPMFASLPCPHPPRVPPPSDLHRAVRAHQSRYMGTQVLVDLDLLRLVLVSALGLKQSQVMAIVVARRVLLQYASAYFARPIHLLGPR
jgi:hypothetical protein